MSPLMVVSTPPQEGAPRKAGEEIDIDVDQLRLFWSFPLAHVAEKFGNRVALRLAEELGGQPIYMPMEYDARHPIVPIAGEGVLRLLMGVNGIDKGMRFTMPTAALARRQITERRVALYLRRGLRVTQIADILKIHIRTTHRMVARIREKAAADAKAAAAKAKR